MSLSDVLLLAAVTPVIAMVGGRLVAAMGFGGEWSPDGAILWATALAGILLLVRLLVRLGRLARDVDVLLGRAERVPRRAHDANTSQVVDFAIHLDRRHEVDFTARDSTRPRRGSVADTHSTSPAARPRTETTAPGIAPTPRVYPEGLAPGSGRLLGEVRTRLAGIPSVRRRGGDEGPG